MNIDFIFQATENKSYGREVGVYEPNSEFLENIDSYLHNRFLDIGNNYSFNNQLDGNESEH